ncbi:MAG: DUF4234 domain-containing protein [Bdellovibrio sp.]|nr:DUF4234 domain-containing protein [Bdellovibrio sp.]
MPIVKYRNMWLQILLMIVTFGTYSIYWFYVTCEELKALTKDEKASPTLWTILLFVPFGCFYSFYCQGELYEKISLDKINRWFIFLLWLFFPVGTWFIIQTDLNKLAKQSAPTTVVN